MNRFIVFISLLFLLFGCNSLKENEYVDDYTYSDMVIDQFEYNDIPAIGGTVRPILKYHYTRTDQNGNAKVMNTYATLNFSATDSISQRQKIEIEFLETKSQNANFSLDSLTGAISAQVNPTIDTLVYFVKVKVWKENTCAESSCRLIQEPSEEKIVNTYTVQRPIELEPHTCILPIIPFGYKHDNSMDSISPVIEYTSKRTDGLSDRDYSAYREYYTDQLLTWWFNNKAWGKEGYDTDTYKTLDYEFIHPKGETISFRGGELVTYVEYYSGKKDSTIVEPVFSTSVTTEFVRRYLNRPGYTTIEEVSFAPSSSVSDRKWIINPIGAAQYRNTIHTLTASVGDKSVSISLSQDVNYNLGNIDEMLYEGCDDMGYIKTPRSEWPDIDDYPDGSDPRWWKNANGWWVPYLTRHLHYDGSRYVDLYIHVYIVGRYKTQLYLSGATSLIYGGGNGQVVTREETKSDKDINYSLFTGNFSATAEADVTHKDGTKEHVKHTYTWLVRNETLHMTEGDNLAIYIPPVDNVKEEFEWTIKVFLHPQEGDSTISRGVVGINNNFHETNWQISELKIKESLSSIEKFRNDKNIQGFQTSGSYSKDGYLEDYEGYGLPDYYDGVYYEGRKGYNFPNSIAWYGNWHSIYD